MIFANPPKIFAHKASIESGNFVTHDAILNKGTDTKANLFHRFCPHRMYPLHNPGEIVQNVNCTFHNFNWDKDGTPLDNTKKLHCGVADVGRSGLVMENFVEPDHKWVDDLAKEKNLLYRHSYTGESTGSWMWLMDAEADLLHLHRAGIHSLLSQQVTLEDIKMEQGDGWILQTHPDGWWLYVFPFSFVEYGEPGMVFVNTVVPNDLNSEYGYKWITQFYYDPSVDINRKIIFETAEGVFKEDVIASEKQKGDYFPLMKAMNQYEDHCVQWGQWVRDNRINE